MASADWLPIKIDVFLENDMGACSGDFIFYYVVIGVKWSTHIAETIIDRKGDSIVLGKRKPPDRRNESALKEREGEREREREREKFACGDQPIKGEVTELEQPMTVTKTKLDCIWL